MRRERDPIPWYAWIWLLVLVLGLTGVVGYNVGQAACGCV